MCWLAKEPKKTICSRTASHYGHACDIPRRDIGIESFGSHKHFIHEPTHHKNKNQKMNYNISLESREKSKTCDLFKTNKYRWI